MENTRSADAEDSWMSGLSPSRYFSLMIFPPICHFAIYMGSSLWVCICKLWPIIPTGLNIYAYYSHIILYCFWVPIILKIIATQTCSETAVLDLEWNAIISSAQHRSVHCPSSLWAWPLDHWMRACLWDSWANTLLWVRTCTLIVERGEITLQ